MTTEIEKHEATIATLSKKLQERQQLAEAVTAKRAALSYSAFTQGGEAQVELAQLNRESAELTCDIENLGNAIEAAKQKLDAARVEAATSQRRKDAKEVKALVAEFVAHGKALDKAFGEIAEHGHLLHEVITKMHALGCAHPADQVVKVNLARSLTSSFMLLPKSWRNQLELPHLPTHQLVSFGDVVGAWAQSINNWVAAIIGKPEKEAA
jgi:hypothetical protein